MKQIEAIKTYIIIYYRVMRNDPQLIPVNARFQFSSLVG